MHPVQERLLVVVAVGPAGPVAPTSPFGPCGPTSPAELPTQLPLASITVLPEMPMLPTTSNVAAGVVVPIPTFTLAVAPLTPLMLPKTSALLALTTAFDPIAVALVSCVGVCGPEL